MINTHVLNRGGRGVRNPVDALGQDANEKPSSPDGKEGSDGLEARSSDLRCGGLDLVVGLVGVFLEVGMEQAGEVLRLRVVGGLVGP